MLKKETIDNALALLGERLEASDGEPIELLVCGGASLIATGMVRRVMTKDIDVVAIIREEGLLAKAEPFPEDFMKSVREVTQMLELPEKWINSGPSALVDAGLPEGIMKRLADTRRYGEKLKVHFIGREDQIFFKVFAAADAGPGRHLEDLRDLQPTTEEMEGAARWALLQDPSKEFRMILKDMLEKIGHEKAAERI